MNYQVPHIKHVHFAKTDNFLHALVMQNGIDWPHSGWIIPNRLGGSIQSFNPSCHTVKGIMSLQSQLGIIVILFRQLYLKKANPQMVHIDNRDQSRLLPCWFETCVVCAFACKSIYQSKKNHFSKRSSNLMHIFHNSTHC